MDTYPITNSKMADKMAVVQGYGCISSVYISFQVVYLITFRRIQASILGFFVDITSVMKFEKSRQSFLEGCQVRGISHVTSIGLSGENGTTRHFYRAVK